MDDDGIIFFELWDEKDKKIANVGEIDALPPSFHSKVEENFTESGLRNAYRKTAQGAVRMVIRANSPLLQGTKAISRACAIYITLVPKFQKIVQSERQHSDTIITRFAHNLTKFQTRFKGNFNRLVSDKARARPYAELREEVKNNIKANLDAAADDVSQMSHRAVDLDAQIETLRIISGFADTSAPTSPVRTDLRRAMFRLSNPFVDELNKKGISFNFDISVPKNETEKILIIHSLFNAAIWQLLDNASKYALENTDITISAVLNEPIQKLEFEMVSVCIEEDEYERIFQERFKGRHAKSKGGSGIGMFVVKKALDLMGAKIKVVNLEHVINKDGFSYCRNRFTIQFKSR